MDWGGPILTSLDVVMREAALFAAAGFVVLGAGDLLVDARWLLRLLGAYHKLISRTVVRVNPTIRRGVFGWAEYRTMPLLHDRGGECAVIKVPRFELHASVTEICQML